MGNSFMSERETVNAKNMCLQQELDSVTYFLYK